MSNEIIVHTEPAWRDRADFIIAARIEAVKSASEPTTEQLWARQLTEFEICCIPFFLYDLALGDKVITGIADEEKYLVKSVTERSGRLVFRVWFREVSDVYKDSLASLLRESGCLLEWRSPSSRLLAIDAATKNTAQQVANILQERENRGEINYETGRLGER